jgi:hypothetical protein
MHTLKPAALTAAQSTHDMSGTDTCGSAKLWLPWRVVQAMQRKTCTAGVVSMCTVVSGWGTSCSWGCGFYSMFSPLRAAGQPYWKGAASGDADTALDMWCSKMGAEFKPRCAGASVVGHQPSMSESCRQTPRSCRH